MARSSFIARDTHRLTISVSLKWDEGPKYYDEFTACCKLAKSTKVVTLVVPASELGTPFNQEIERLRELVKIASQDGILVGLKTEVGTSTENPDTAMALCDNVKGLGLTLDPSHYICGPWNSRSYDNINEVRREHSSSRHEKSTSPSSRRPRRSRIRKAHRSTRRIRLFAGTLRSDHARSRNRSQRRNAEITIALEQL